jgi:hypothetical protein
MNIGFPPFVRSARTISALFRIVLNECSYDQMDVAVPARCFQIDPRPHQNNPYYLSKFVVAGRFSESAKIH